MDDYHVIMNYPRQLIIMRGDFLSTLGDKSELFEGKSTDDDVRQGLTNV